MNMKCKSIRYQVLTQIKEAQVCVRYEVHRMPQAQIYRVVRCQVVEKFENRIWSKITIPVNRRQRQVQIQVTNQIREDGYA